VIETRVITIGETIDKEELAQVADALVKGALVGMPTETVYGLAGNAYLPEVVKKIFSVKGRPQDNPLIVHLYDKKQIEQVVSEVVDIFHVLYEAFCPGPLTMVMPKNILIPDEVTAGLDTVGVRFPAQRTARALLRLANVPVVAPSGNLSGGPSPTKAEHMLDDMQGKIEYILDDGPCDFGVESTVLDLTSNPPRILRPGVITADLIQQQTGIAVVDDLSHLPKAVRVVPVPLANGAESSPGGEAYFSRQGSEADSSQADDGTVLSQLDCEADFSQSGSGADASQADDGTVLSQLDCEVDYSQSGSGADSSQADDGTDSLQPDIEAYFLQSDDETELFQYDDVDIWAPRSPGQKYRHYSPRAKVFIARGENEEERTDFIVNSLAEMDANKVGFFGSETSFGLLKKKISALRNGLPLLKNMVTYLYPGSGDDKIATHELFSAFRALDKVGVDTIIAEEFPRQNYGVAYMNRLERAAERE